MNKKPISCKQKYLLNSSLIRMKVKAAVVTPKAIKKTKTKKLNHPSSSKEKASRLDRTATSTGAINEDIKEVNLVPKKRTPVQQTSFPEEHRRIIVMCVDDQKNFAVDRQKLQRMCTEKHISKEATNALLKRAYLCKRLGYPQSAFKGYLCGIVQPKMMKDISCWRTAIRKLGKKEDKGWKNIKSVYLLHQENQPKGYRFAKNLSDICIKKGVFRFGYEIMEKLLSQMEDRFKNTLRKFREKYGSTRIPYCAFVNYYGAGRETYVPEHSDTTFFGSLIISLTEGKEDGEAHPLEIQLANGYEKMPLPTGSFVAFPPLKHRIPDSSARKEERATLVMFW
jgi:hypothetical protein